MKSKIISVVLAAVLSAGALGFVACKDNKDEKITEVYNMYVASAKQNGTTPLSYEDWLNSIKGADGKDGAGVKNAYIDGNGELILEFTDGTSKNCGKVTAAAPESGGNFYYNEVKEEGKVVGYAVRDIGSVSQTDITIPSVYNGKPVVSIGINALFDCDFITSVTIPDSVKSVEYGAFWGCDALKSVKFGNSVESIGEAAFSFCSTLEELDCPASLKTIGETAFASCNALKEIKFNEGLTEICRSAFTGCNSLESVVIPDSVTTLGFAVFMQCFSLKNVKFSANITEIPERTLSECTAAVNVEMGDKVEKIGYSAFYNMPALESIVLPKSIKEIVSYAFYMLPALETVFYKGTAEEWGAIKIGKNGNEWSTEGNDLGKIYYYSESQPAEEGSFWHYVDGVPAKW